MAHVPGRAACEACSSFEPGLAWGTVMVGTLREASGMVASARNPGVLWTHNDGPRSRLFALGTNGALLATFDFSTTVGDVEDIAIGPGPVSGVSYIYVGDIGGSQELNGLRPQVRILRVPEPAVSLAWVGNPVSGDLGQIEGFTLEYPDGSYDAETLWVDPISGLVFVVTKEASRAQVYRANLAGKPAALEWVNALDFPRASGGDI